MFRDIFFWKQHSLKKSWPRHWRRTRMNAIHFNASIFRVPFYVELNTCTNKYWSRKIHDNIM